jgi:hypothetical protein
LLDVQSSIDPDDAESKPRETVTAKDTSVLMSDWLVKYPASPGKWDAEKLAKLTIHQQSGIRCGRAHVLSGSALKTAIFEDQHPDSDWVLEEVVEDMNCLFLKVTKSLEDGGDAIKLVCIPPWRTKQIKAHLDLAPLYLVAGTFATLEEARQLALELNKRCRDSNFTEFAPQVWSLTDEKHAFAVALPSPLHKLAGNGFATLRTALGVDLIPRSSGRFQARFDLE